MTIGIYCLQFEGTDKVYIGQSINIERRIIEHKYYLSKKLAPKKLQEAYDLYGKPSTEVLVECDVQDLNNLETEAISIYNSFYNGFNSIKSPNNMQQYGLKVSPNIDNIILAFQHMLDKPEDTLVKISLLYNVSRTCLAGIKNLNRYAWLKDIFGDLYTRYINSPTILSNRHSIKALGISHPPIQSPSGEVFQVDNIKAFAETHGLDRSNIGKVLRGKKPQYKGWKLWVQPEQV